MIAPAPRYDLDEIRANLSVDLVLDHYGIEVERPARGNWRGHQCPLEYHRKSPGAFAIDPETGLWICYAGCVGADGTRRLAGDLFTIIAIREELPVTREGFTAAVPIAAELTGVAPGVVFSPAERAARDKTRRDAIERRKREQAAARREHRARSIAEATAYWNALAARGAPGEDYLRSRGLLAVVARGLVRFDRRDRDSIAMPLRTYDGMIANVIRRRLPAWAPTADDRFRPLPGLWAKGTYVGAIAEIGAAADAHGPELEVVLAEGLADSLTAVLAWPRAVVLGARSAPELPEIAGHAAPLIAKHGGRLLMVPHRDDAGFTDTKHAIDVALAAGLRLDAGTLAIVDHSKDDLNASWCAGWRPSTTSTRSAA